ncbi:Glu/Leu/Phe/Val dehydrogenase [Candidatus Woesearchaeota archaeon]|nr:Glu/Leu/Phe/Val dehydrogenase [Candidatus Woesearchaeota archaeon]
MDIFSFMQSKGIPRLDFVRGFSSAVPSLPSVRQVEQEFRKSSHASVTFVQEYGARLIFAVHSTRRGPALGGFRLYDYKTETDALQDVLRLSQAMTYKSAAVELPFGGGKAVGWIDGKKNLDVCSKSLVSFAGRYITGEDLGVTVNDMDYVLSKIKRLVSNPNVVGTSRRLGGCGDPSIATAKGVFAGISVCVKVRLRQKSVRGLRVALQGCGKVGTPLGKMLIDAGAEVVTTSRRRSSTRTLQKYGAERVEPDDIYDVQSDVFCPAAIGGVINPETIPRLSCKIIAGPANNQLSNVAMGNVLRKSNILYAPDFVINAGGLIAAAHEYMAREKGKRFSWPVVEAYLKVIPKNLSYIFSWSSRQRISTAVAAVQFAKSRLK